MTVRLAFPPINFCLLLMLSVAVVAGSLQVEKQHDELERHAAELRLHRQYGEKLIAEIETLRSATASTERVIAPSSTADAGARGEQ